MDLLAAGPAIRTKERAALVFIGPDGTNDALNGTAKAQMEHAADIDAIWANDRSLGAGLKKDLGPLIQRGLKLC